MQTTASQAGGDTISRSTRHLPTPWLSQRVNDHRRALVGD
jgi:hypothetical protein